jgi:hypothetical protein
MSSVARRLSRVVPFLFSLPIIAAPIEFTEADAHVALAAASNLVERCTPRDAGTVRGRLAANWILDRVSRTGADASLDKFRAPTPDGERTFANVTVEFPGTKTNAAWIVVMSHFDTMPNIGEGFQAQTTELPRPACSSPSRMRSGAQAASPRASRSSGPMARSAARHTAPRTGSRARAAW